MQDLSQTGSSTLEKHGGGACLFSHLKLELRIQASHCWLEAHQ